MRPNPCFTCELKGCGALHDHCPDYKRWCKENQNFKDRRKADYLASEYIIKKIQVKRKKKW